MSLKKEINSNVLILFFFIWLIIKLSAWISKSIEYLDISFTKLLFNEIAPRPHNSFHWTIEGCATSQFAQLARLLAGMPFGATHIYGNWQMDNLLGEDMWKLPELLGSAGTHVHLYGKGDAETGRKMGHTNRMLGS